MQRAAWCWYTAEGEHAGRYEHVASWFASRGFAVWAMDHRGHGRSEGTRMHVDRFADYLVDLAEFVKLAAGAHGRPVMIGHSMGGLIAYRYAAVHPDTISALVLSSPWFLSRAKVSRVAAGPGAAPGRHCPAAAGEVRHSA